MSATVATVTDATFRQQVLESPRPVLVDFGASWCPPCRVMEPILEAVARDRAGELEVVSVDVDVNSVSADAYDVRSLPTMLVVRDGQVRARIVGAVPRARLEAVLREVL